MTKPTGNKEEPGCQEIVRRFLVVLGLLILGCLIFVGGCAAILFIIK
jgi:hypothetical protein